MPFTINCIICGHGLLPSQHPRARFCIPCQQAVEDTMRRHPFVRREIIERSEEHRKREARG